MTNYILYKYTGGHLKYLCDYHDSKYGHITRTPLESKAAQFGAEDALERACRGEWFIRPVAESPPPLGIHVSDGVGSGDKIGG